MPTGTKIIIAVIVALFGSVVIYFAFVAPPASPAGGQGGQGTSATGLGPKPSTPAPLSKPTPTAPPTASPNTPPTSPDRGSITAGVPSGSRPAPAVSDPMSAVGRDPTRPAVDPTSSTQGGGKGEATPVTPPTNPGTNGGANPSGTSNPPASPTATPPTGSGTNPGANPGTNPGSNPGSNPGTSPGTTPSTNPPANPGSGAVNPPKPGGPTPVNPSPSPAVAPPAKPTGTTPAGTTTGDKREHVVANGDTMSSIAEKYFGDKNQWQLISKANPLVDPARMAIGTKLVIPAKPAASSAPSGSNGTTGGASKPTAPLPGANTHTIASGDTLISLSRKYYGKDTLWELIYDANKKVIGDDPANLKVGMVLTIPAKPAS